MIVLKVTEFTVISGPKLTVVTPDRKFVPLSITESGWPMFPEVGAMLISVGAGLLTAKADERTAVPPPGAAFVTETSFDPSDAEIGIVTLAVI